MLRGSRIRDKHRAGRPCSPQACHHRGPFTADNAQGYKWEEYRGIDNERWYCQWVTGLLPNASDPTTHQLMLNVVGRQPKVWPVFAVVVVWIPPCAASALGVGNNKPASSLFGGIPNTTHLWRRHTAKTKCRKFETYISRKGISGPQSQFPHSCVCERIIYSHDGSACSAVGNMW